MRRRLPEVRLSEKQLSHCVAGYYAAWRKVEDMEEGNRIDGPGERVAKAQIRQVAHILGEHLEQERQRAVKKRDACSGLTHKTSLRRRYWDGRIDTLGLMDTLLLAMMVEVGDGE